MQVSTQLSEFDAQIGAQSIGLAATFAVIKDVQGETQKIIMYAYEVTDRRQVVNKNQELASKMGKLKKDT